MKLALTKAGMSFMMMALFLSGCGRLGSSTADSSSGAVVDESASGAAASAAGGALSSSEASGTQASYQARQLRSGIWAMINHAAQWQSAQASNSCPTFASASGSGCEASGSDMWLSYSSCQFHGAAQWTGVQEITKSSGSATCGTFPEPPASGTLYRQFVQASGSSTPGSVTLEADGLTAVIDDASANLNNFDGDSISTIENSGYGAAIDFNSSGARTGMTLAHRIYVSGVFDHSVTGDLSINESAGGTSRIINGSVTVYHNLMKVIGNATFTNVVHEDVCCLPVSGTISTEFAAGTNVSPTVAGSALVGKTETLTFTGCGTATYTSTSGKTSDVVLHRCF